MNKLIFLVFVFLICVPAFQAQDYSLKSPDGRSEVRIRVDKAVSYSIFHNSKTVVFESPISLSVKEVPAKQTFTVARKSERTVHQMVTTVVPDKRKRIRDNFNELKLIFSNGTGLIWRAYNNGIAYRWTTDILGQITVNEEQAEIKLDPADVLYYPEEDEGFYSHNERRYINYRSWELEGKLASLPALVDSRSGVKLWISEADLYDYAGMWLRGMNGKGVKAVFPKYPQKETQIRDRDLKVTDRADFIAKTQGQRSFPWRVFAIAERDVELLDNQIVYLLSEDTKEDFSWVRPGKVPWDWWNANNVYGVGFKSGVNTETYKYYVDFAAKHGLEYLILDEGWSKTDDLLSVNPDINLPELISYAKKKNVGIVLWVVWLTLDKQFDRAFDQFEKWGVKGIKVDFMQRDDQKMVNFYERTANEGARRKMLVDFHGAYKPTGMERKYPNALTREGVKGLENDKWSKEVTPEHDVTLPFIRMVAGPMDYTPGAMLNAVPARFLIDFERPMSQGTRCHQLAMYVVYESPLQMLADNPSNYQREPEAMEFLSKVPTVWNETIALDGKIGEYALMARQTDKGEWYVGAMNNSKPRELAIDLTFLDKGTYQATIWQDGVNSNRVGMDFQKITKTVKKGDKITANLGIGGGWVARITKKLRG